MKHPIEISIDYLRECFDYSPLTGVLRWRIDRPAGHFPSEAYRKRWTSRYGGIAIKRVINGYLSVVIKKDGVKRSFQSHRVIFAMVYGRWPYPTIDHVNGIRDDNRLVNLREATVWEQRQNSLPSRSTAIARGVRPNGPGFMARIQVDGKLQYLGQFATKEEAAAAYLAAKARLHSFQSGFHAHERCSYRGGPPSGLELPYYPRPHFIPVHKSVKRFKLVVAHRRCGKTVALVNTLIFAALNKKRKEPPPRYAYVAPSFEQAKDLTWGYLKQYTRTVPGMEFLEGELVAKFINGSSIRLYGGSLAYETHQGIIF